VVFVAPPFLETYARPNSVKGGTASMRSSRRLLRRGIGAGVSSGRERLPNSPLIEVACEIRFPGDFSLLSSLGGIQTKLRYDYPKLLVPAVQPGSFPLLQTVRLTSDDNTNMVLLAMNSFGVSTHSYTTYGDFRSRFAKALDVFQSHFSPPTLTRFGLRYVNALPPPSEGSSKVVHPTLRIAVSGVDGDWRAQPQLMLETARGRMTLRTVLIQPQPVTTAPGFLLDPGVRLDFDCYQKDPVGVDVLTLLDEAHTIVDEAFFDMITPDYLQYLEGKS
jgi:uncharacterized protein (TIGR04255 family)